VSNCIAEPGTWCHNFASALCAQLAMPHTSNIPQRRNARECVLHTYPVVTQIERSHTSETRYSIRRLHTPMISIAQHLLQRLAFPPPATTGSWELLQSSQPICNCDANGYHGDPGCMTPIRIRLRRCPEEPPNRTSFLVQLRL
jgi:hypothetical protein